MIGRDIHFLFEEEPVMYRVFLTKRTEREIDGFFEESGELSGTTLTNMVEKRLGYMEKEKWKVPDAEKISIKKEKVEIKKREKARDTEIDKLIEEALGQRRWDGRLRLVEIADELFKGGSFRRTGIKADARQSIGRDKNVVHGTLVSYVLETPGGDLRGGLTIEVENLGDYFFESELVIGKKDSWIVYKVAPWRITKEDKMSSGKVESYRTSDKGEMLEYLRKELGR